MEEELQFEWEEFCFTHPDKKDIYINQEVK